MAYFLLLALLCTAPVAAEPRVEQDIQYYSVVADDLGTLEMALASAVPERPGGAIFHGYTHSEVHWRWKFVQRAGRCSIDRVESDVQTSITLPKLISQSPSSDASKVWRQWYPALLQHERNHANNAVQVARRGETRLLTLPSAASCDQLNRRARAIADAMIEQLRRIDVDYDARTNHGESEGASLRSYRKLKAAVK